MSTTPTPALHLYEEILLLALRDQEGTVAFGAWYQQALAGALLAELALLARVRVSSDAVLVLTTETTGNQILDDALDLIESSEKPRKPGHWLSKLANQKDVLHRCAATLVDRGILAAEKDRVLFFFQRRVYPERDPAPEEALIARLEAAIFTDTDQVDARTLAVIALAQRTSILAPVFGKKRLKERAQRIDQLIAGDLCGAAAKEVVEALQAAIFVTTIVTPVIVS